MIRQSIWQWTREEPSITRQFGETVQIRLVSENFLSPSGLNLNSYPRLPFEKVLTIVTSPTQILLAQSHLPDGQEQEFFTCPAEFLLAPSTRASAKFQPCPCLKLMFIPESVPSKMSAFNKLEKWSTSKFHDSGIFQRIQKKKYFFKRARPRYHALKIFSGSDKNWRRR